MGLAVKQDLPFWSIHRLTAEEKASVSSSISQTWTDQATKCYLTEANCTSCSIPRGDYSFTCQMYKVVPVLLENLGVPDANRQDRVIPFLHEY